MSILLYYSCRPVAGRVATRPANPFGRGCQCAEPLSPVWLALGFHAVIYIAGAALPNPAPRPPDTCPTCHPGANVTSSLLPTGVRLASQFFPSFIPYLKGVVMDFSKFKPGIYWAFRRLPATKDRPEHEVAILCRIVGENPFIEVQNLHSFGEDHEDYCCDLYGKHFLSGEARLGEPVTPPITCGQA